MSLAPARALRGEPKLVPFEGIWPSQTWPPYRVAEWRENVAFLLIVAGPLLRRLGLRGRWLATVGLVAWFALLTRFEPSVLRACSMAGLAATARLTDRRASPLRLLALVVAGLTLLDPMLVRAAGWWLSVGATATAIPVTPGRSPRSRFDGW